MNLRDAMQSDSIESARETHVRQAEPQESLEDGDLLLIDDKSIAGEHNTLSQNYFLHI